MLSPTSHRPRRCCFNTSSKPVAIKYRINGALNRRLRPAHAFLRREILQAVFFLGDDLPDGRTVVNSVLSAYGLPNISNTKGFKAYDNFSSDYQFIYPKSWVLRKNSQRPGLYISDFQTADKAVVEELTLLDGESLVDVVVAAAVAPGANMGTDRLSLPRMEAVKVEEFTIDGNRYVYLQFPSETVTNSGYNIKRRNFVVAGVRDRQVYSLCASARSDQYNEAKGEQLVTIVQSFRLR